MYLSKPMPIYIVIFYYRHRITFNSSVSSFNDADDKEDHVETVVPVGLQTWRNTIARATSPAQLMLCIVQLNNSISWEKSIMKVVSCFFIIQAFI